MMYGPRIAGMRYFQHIFWRVMTKSRSILLGISTIPYLFVSMALLSAAGGPVASPTSLRQRRAVSASIISSGPSGTQARRRGMLQHPIDVAIDERDIPPYAKVTDRAHAVLSRYKKDAKKFHPVAAIHCVVDGHLPTPGVEAIRRDGDAAGTARRLLRRARRRGIRMSSITIYRGFHSVDVIYVVKAAGIPLVTPAVKMARFMADRDRAHLDRAHLDARPPVTLNRFVSLPLEAANMQSAGNPAGVRRIKPIFQTPDTLPPMSMPRLPAAAPPVTHAAPARPRCHHAATSFRVVISKMAGPRPHLSGLGLCENQERKSAPPLSVPHGLFINWTNYPMI